MELVGDLVATRGSEPMRPSKEELSHGAESAIDLVSAVEELHRRSSLELHKSLKENEDFCICCCSEKGLSVKIDVEKLAGLLPLHLIAVLMTSDRDEEMFRYLLSGIRLLHTLCDLAPRHTKLEQVLLEDVKLSEQMLDLVFYSLIVLGGNGQGSCRSDGLSLMQTTLVASCLYLLHGFISPQWQDLVQVLLAHPKVDVFIDAAFGAVHNVVRSLQMKLLSQGTDLLTKSGIYYERAVNYHCQQAEAALQFLHSLCQQKPFRERLAKNKELCGNGGVLMLAQSILSLTVPPQLDGSATMTASISRMKAKVLSILLHLFEAESVSFLDEVASAGNLRLAESIATEVLELLRLGLSKASKDFTASSDYPMGFVLLNAMRLADVFTDDSNFRSFFTQHFSEVLSAIFLLPHGDFLSMWCSSDLPSREDEATLDYDQFASAGWILDSFSSSSDQLIATQFKLNLLPSNHPKASYVHQRTSFFIKMIANLHCFVPKICEEQERNRFIHNFTGGLQRDPSSILPGFSYTLTARRGASVCRNLRSLLSHAESLIPNFLNEEDLLLLRVFFDQLQPLIRSEFEESQVQETQSTGGYSSAKQRKESLNLNNGNSNLNEETSENSAFRAEGVTRQGIKEEKESVDRSKILGENDADAHNLETSGSDTSSTRGKSCIDRVEDGELLKTDKRSKESGSGGVKEDEKVETVQGVEKQRRKRKRSIMNDEQMAMIERALLDEPDMQRNSASIQTWADKLSHYGSEVTTSQLKNWLNNRKAKLARASKQAGPARDNSSGDLPDSPGEENISQKPSTLKGSNQVASRSARTGENSKSSGEAIKTGQLVALMDEKGEEVGRGKVERTDGKWYGVSLDATGACVVDVVELTGCDKRERLPYPSEATGSTFEEAESRFGVMRVAWDASKLRNEMH